MITVAEPIDADALRIRHEFLTLSNLRASVEMCALLLNIPQRHAKLILEGLVRDGFLQRIGEVDYIRRRASC